jgi:hypothetical protein
MIKVISNYSKVNPAETENADGIERLIEYSEDIIEYEEGEYYDLTNYDAREVGEIFKKGTACYLAYCISVKNDAKNKNGGVIKFDSALLPTVFEFMEKNDDQEWIRLLIDENGGKLIWGKNNKGIGKRLSECRIFGYDALNEMLVRMGLIEQEPEEKDEESSVIIRHYNLLNPYDVDNKDGESFDLLDYTEELGPYEPDSEMGVIYQKGHYCYLDYWYYPYGCEAFKGTVKFDSSLLSDIYGLLNNNYQENTIRNFIMDRSGKWIRSEHNHQIWEDEDEYGPHDPNDPRYVNKESETTELETTVFEDSDELIYLPF